MLIDFPSDTISASAKLSAQREIRMNAQWSLDARLVIRAGCTVEQSSCSVCSQYIATSIVGNLDELLGEIRLAVTYRQNNLLSN
jgi:hypothetical protein